MLRFAARRLVSMVLVLFAISVLVFVIFFATPGVDPAARIAGRNADQATLQAVRKDFGLDRPMPVQYALMMKKLFVTRDLDLVREPRRGGDSPGDGGGTGDALARHRRGGDLGRPQHPDRAPRGGLPRHSARRAADEHRLDRHLDTGVLARRGREPAQPEPPPRHVRVLVGPAARLRAADRVADRLVQGTAAPVVHARSALHRHLRTHASFVARPVAGGGLCADGAGQGADRTSGDAAALAAHVDGRLHQPLRSRLQRPRRRGGTAHRGRLRPARRRQADVRLAPESRPSGDHGDGLIRRVLRRPCRTRWSTSSTRGSTHGCGLPEAGHTPLLEVRDLRVAFRSEEGLVRAVDGVSLSVAARRGGRDRRRVRLGQDRIDAGGDAADPRSQRGDRGAGLPPRARPVAAVAERDPLRPWPRDRNGLPGSDDVAHTGLYRRLADRRAAARARAAEQAAGARAHASSSWRR